MPGHAIIEFLVNLAGELTFESLANRLRRRSPASPPDTCPRCGTSQVPPIPKRRAIRYACPKCGKLWSTPKPPKVVTARAS